MICTVLPASAHPSSYLRWFTAAPAQDMNPIHAACNHCYSCRPDQLHVWCTCPVHGQRAHPFSSVRTLHHDCATVAGVVCAHRRVITPPGPLTAHGPSLSLPPAPPPTWSHTTPHQVVHMYYASAMSSAGSAAGGTRPGTAASRASSACFAPATSFSTSSANSSALSCVIGTKEEKEPRFQLKCDGSCRQRSRGVF